MPSDHSIPFTLRDHLHACLNCFPPVSISACFPSLTSSSSRRLCSSSASSTSSDDNDEHDQQRRTHFPRNGHHPSPRNDQEYEEDVAAWGSDALSLRSQAGRGKGSRNPNARRSGMGWFIALFAGRTRNGRVVDTLEDVEAEEDEEEGILGGWGGEGDWDDLPVPRGVDEDEGDDVEAPDFDLGNPSDFDDDPEAALEGEGEWGAFLSAPLTSARSTSSRPRSPGSPSPSSTPPLPTRDNSHHNHNTHNLHINTSSSSSPSSSTSARVVPPEILTAHVDLPSTLPLPPSPFPPLSLPSSPTEPLLHPQPPAEPKIEINAEEEEDEAADLGSEYFGSSTTRRPQSKSTRRSYTSSGVTSSTMTTATSEASGRSRSSTRSSSAGGKTAGSAAEPFDPDTTLPSPSHLYDAPNPFSFPTTTTPNLTPEEAERKRKEEKKERKRERREKREVRHATARENRVE